MVKHITRREFLCVATSVAAGSLIGACAGAQAPAAQPTQAPAQAAPTLAAVATAAPKATPAPAKKVSVQFLNIWGATREPLMNDAIKNFQEDNPGIEVVNDVQSSDNWDQRVSTAIASGKPPAVIMVLTPRMALFAHQGLIAPIDSYIDKRGLKVYDIFYKADIDAMRWGSNYYSMPMPSATGRNDYYIYNKTLFGKAGLDPENPPKTWDELYKAAKATTVFESKIMKTIGAQVVVLDTPSPSEPGSNFTNWLYCNNGAFISDDAKKLTFNSAEGVETLEWMTSFTNEINGGFENVTGFLTGAASGAADYPFYKDRLAMWFTGDWAFSFLGAYAKEMYGNPKAWGVALRPYNGKNTKAASHGNAGPGTWVNTIAKSSPQEVQDAAYLWVEYLAMNQNGGCKFLYSQMRPSAAKTCNAHYPYKDSNPYWDTVLKAKESDLPLPVTPAHAEIAALLATAVEQALRGQKKAKEALDSAAAEGQAILDKFWKS